jgi:streptogramin lyase
MKPQTHVLSFVLASATLLPLAALLSGCGAASVSTAAVEGTALNGRLVGGQQPISGATISLYAAGLGGTGTGATSLLSANVLSGADGGFSISHLYTCPSASTQVYIVARGGNPGLGGSVNNAASVLMAPLGDCGNLTSSTYITINEVTTVASAWALAQFAPAGVASGAMFGASPTNATGLRNAFLVASNLVNVSTGLAGGATLPAGAALESTKLYTLADVLATCINSNGGAACTPLFAASTSTTVPTNTLDAALQIVRHPGANISAVYNAANPQGPFQPTLTATPNDWTMSISYIGGGLYEPTALGIDSTGSIWAANYLGGQASKLSATGVPAAANGFQDPTLYESFGLAVDGQDSVWITVEESSGGINSGDGSISKFSSSGALLSGSGFTAGNIYYPYGIAADSNGDIWVADYGHIGSSATLLATDGSSLSGTNGFNAQLPFPVSVALDGNHNAWFAAEQVAGEVAPNGTSSIFTCCRGPVSVALDPAANVWLADFMASALVQLTPAGTVQQRLQGAGGIRSPQTVTTDAAGNLWATNFRGGSISGFTAGASAAALSPATGFGVDPGLSEPFGIAIDASGNVWVSNFDPAYNSLTQFVGLAVPTRTPRLGLPAAP